LAEKKKVSFITPHKGLEEFLYQTLQSIFSIDFTHDDMEILVVSQNKNLYALHDFSNKLLALSIHYLPEPLTISALRNQAYSLSSRQYLAFLNADVSLSVNGLSTMIDLLEERKLVSKMQINDENPLPLEQILTVLSNAELACNVNFLPGRNSFLHRDTFIN
jgi:glycosyltransferase involved in cell wall biosynthesis